MELNYDMVLNVFKRTQVARGNGMIPSLKAAALVFLVDLRHSQQFGCTGSEFQWKKEQMIGINLVEFLNTISYDDRFEAEDFEGEDEFGFGRMIYRVNENISLLNVDQELQGSINHVFDKAGSLNSEKLVLLINHLDIVRETDYNETIPLAENDFA